MASQENTEPLSSDNLSRVSIQSVQLVPALSQRYLAYALSTIMSRSLPDVRDGLKPVHRRLIYAMKQLQLQPETNPKKSARVVGDVIGKYHPHGDTAIYEAMVRLAQDFAQRYPLVDGQGNFGNIDGDNPAAMRYTEVRLTEVAMLMLEGIDEDAVDFRFTYDNEGQEPIILPAAFPNLLANGSQGIAVGMATNIPPHNVAEICDALILLIKNPQTTNAEVLKIIQGPDFPTGGVLLETKENLNRIYEQGKGSVRLRAQWQTEKLKSGQWQAVVTEIPYQIHKSKLIEQIAEQIDHKKLPLLDTVRDESTTDIRIVLEPKSRNTEPDILMEHLFRQTDLEIKYSLNMNLLNAENVPGIMSLQEILQAYLTHRQQVLTRCSQFRLSAVNNRLHIVDGLLKVYLNLDELIRLIREEDHPHQAIMKKWHLTDVQAESILNMRLRSLRKLEQFEIEQEFQKLTEEKSKLNILLKDTSLQWQYIGQEIAGLKKRFSKNTPLGKRRTQISNPSHRSDKLEAIDISLPSEPMTIFYSAKGWIRSYKGSYLNSEDIKHKEGDEAYLSVAAGSNDQLLLFSD
ncbi:MAG TPA: DNA topoisomerase IV subunit A, partial [Alphaproteobacteria bacterium]|nr:DNA topoisomerase IV subunit A [Alphaproteobacteria bacterium]